MESESFHCSQRISPTYKAFKVKLNQVTNAQVTEVFRLLVDGGAIELQHAKHLSLIGSTTSSGVFECVSGNPLFELAGIWTLLTGVIGFFAMGIDKSRAVYGEWRTSEKTLFTMALVGGFWGVVLASELFHHKSSKLSFLVVVYGIMALWLFLLSRIGFLGCFLSSITPH